VASAAILDAVNGAAVPLTFAPGDYDPLLDWIGESSTVLIGEASHGTHDFYRQRALITRRLIAEKQFSAVAIEGDWPDAYRVHRFVRGSGTDSNARDALADFTRFPSWMWRNTDVLAFVDWLRQFNDAIPQKKDRVGFFGLDLYSLHASMRAVLDYLQKVDPEAAQRARYRYSCFDHYGEDTQAYGYAANFSLTKTCEDEVVSQLVEMRRRAADLAARDGLVEPDDYLSAEQNARLVQNAERYYRSMFGGRAESWNVRDTHMAETLDWLRRIRPGLKVVVWAHNSHLGDARATEMSSHGEVNLGQLVRERYVDDTFLLGFTTHSGEVTAASEWDALAERKRVRAALKGSYEELFHQTRIPEFLLSLRDTKVAQVLRKPLLERAIGVIYRPETERLSHYFRASLPDQFDAVIHLDRTRALIPFERTSTWESGETPETYPYAV
jgi:erythromycin esterase-like protein